MSRPWWHDEYWKKDEKQSRKRLRLPSRRTTVWIALLVLSMVLAASSTGFVPSFIPWVIAFISFFCRLLLYCLVIRALLSWFRISQSNIFIKILDDVKEPIVSPLRKILPNTGIFDVSIIIAAIILYFVPILLNLFL